MYSVPVMNTKDKNVESPDYSGFSNRMWRILDVFGSCNEHWKKKFVEFPDYSGVSYRIG